MFKRKKPFDYFQSFVDFTDCALRAAEFLKDTVDHFDPEEFATRMDDMHRIEHEADELNHRVSDRLAKEFLPPIEREDIARLCMDLDDVVDSIDDIMRRMGMFGLKSLRPETSGFCAHMVECASALKELAIEFRHFKKSSRIRDCLIRINALETQGDTLHYESIRTLFSERGDPFETLIWKDLFEDFENFFDDCEDVADVIKGVVIKNT